MEGLTRNELYLLAQSLERIKNKNKKFMGPLIVGDTKEPIGLKCIQDKIYTYTNFDDYINDVKNLVTAVTKNDAKLKKSGKNLIQEIVHDVKSIEDCAECVQNWLNDRDAYFVEVCQKPHLLVLAKFGNYHWPAKVMSVLGDKVTVEFFGDHTQADVFEGNCYLYRQPKKSKDNLFNKAVKEADKHIANVIEKFDSFVPAQNDRTNFYAENLENHLKTMFPGALKKIKQEQC